MPFSVYTDDAFVRSHLAILSPLMALALLSGRKRVESRLSRTRRAPYDIANAGDMVWLKCVGGPIVGRGSIARVEYFSELTPREIRALEKRYAALVMASHDYWNARRACRYAAFIWLERVRAVRHAPSTPRQFGAGWVVME